MLKSEGLSPGTRQLGDLTAALNHHAIMSGTDQFGRITEVNDKLCETSGYSRAELLGQDHRLFNSDWHPKAFFQEMYQTIGSGNVWRGEMRNRAKNGSVYWVATTITPFLGADGRPTHYLAIRTEITQNKLIEFELQELQAQLGHQVQKRTTELQSALDAVCALNAEREIKTAALQASEEAAQAANRAKSDFLANMSHEIRTPMNGVVGMVDLLQQSELTPVQHRMLGTIQKSALSLLRILNDILDYSKIEAGKMLFEPMATHLRETVEGVAQLMAPNAQAKALTLSVWVSPELPPWMWCDPTRLGQILLNLLSNAIKFTENRTEQPGRVSIEAQPCTLPQGTAGVRMIVKDNGIGISAEAQARLFTPFTQADESTARKFGGTGLGLSICRRLVLKFGGSLTLCSSLGHGAEFIVELPLQEAEPLRLPLPHCSLTGVNMVAVTSDPLTTRIVADYCAEAGATVMVVEDKPALARHLCRLPADDTPHVVLLGLDASSSDSQVVELPAGVGLVRLVHVKEQARDLAAHEVILRGSPLLHDDLVQGVAQAGGRTDCLQQSDFSALEADLPGGLLTVPPSVPRGQLILLADDVETNREVMQAQLALLGYDCELAVDGVEALAMWRTGRYALLLTDCHMPNMDGFELTAAIRQAEPPSCRLPIVAITANAMQGQGRRCLEMGMDDYLAKPLRMAELAPMLSKWLPPSQTSALALWDVATLGDLVGDSPALQARLASKFLLNAQTQVAAILVSAQAGDWSAAADLGHALKSAARMVGALQLGALCEAIETAGSSADASGCNKLVSGLTAALDSAAACYQARLGSRA